MPGTPIPAEIHYTLLMDPMSHLLPGGRRCLVDAEGGDIYRFVPANEYTYAIIVQGSKEKTPSNSSFLGKIYQIDIGYSEYKIVSSLDLYKFSRPEESSQSRDNTPSTPTSLRFWPPVFGSLPPLPWEDGLKTPSSKHHSPKKLQGYFSPRILKEVTSVVEQAWKAS